jgi:hypothetical protein
VKTSDFDDEAVRMRAADAWKSKPELRAEFASQEAYIAYCAAEEKGRVKIFAPNQPHQPRRVG